MFVWDYNKNKTGYVIRLPGSLLRRDWINCNLYYLGDQVVNLILNDNEGFTREKY